MAEQLVGTELYIDKELIKTYNREYTYEEVENYMKVAGVAFIFSHPEHGKSGTASYARYSDKTVSVHNGETWKRVPMEECTARPRDAKARRHIAAYDIWKEHLTVGSIIKEWTASRFHAMVTAVNDTTFNWVSINAEKYHKEGLIEFQWTANNTGLGKIERARLGQLTWNAINLTEGEKE